jgi:hypothetical protein
MRVKALYHGFEFGLIEHRHFGLAAPAPEPLHLAKIIAGFSLPALPRTFALRIFALTVS